MVAQSRHAVSRLFGDSTWALLPCPQRSGRSGWLGGTSCAVGNLAEDQGCAQRSSDGSPHRRHDIFASHFGFDSWVGDEQLRNYGSALRPVFLPVWKLSSVGGRERKFGRFSHSAHV